MGLLKKTGKKVLKAPVKLVTLPFGLVAPKGVRKNQRYFTDMVRARHSAACPFCGQGHLLAVSELSDYENGEPVIEEVIETDLEEDKREDKKSKGQLWQCNFCYQHIKTKSRQVSEVVSYIKNNGREIYEGGYAYQARQDKLQNGELRELVAKRITYSRFFFVLSGLAIIPFLYGAAQGALLYSFATLLFGLMLGFIGVSNSYRAWQLYTDNVYSENAKEQFHWWLRNRNWFISPNNPDYDKDITIEDSLYDEDYEQENVYDDVYVPADDIDIEYTEERIADFSLLVFYYVLPVYVEPQPQDAVQDELPKPNMFKYQAYKPVNPNN
ncbi:hypothetical protein [Psychrobacter sp. AOP31-A1-22]|uniref:hypothetical protein n=1 Tax=Psychrobacter sp. AOP31-A1-22 TaxID=3457696 RepID=UPI0040351DEC